MRHAYQPHPPNPMHVAREAQHLAHGAKQDKMSVAFQWVALVSMGAMGVAALGSCFRDLLVGLTGRDGKHPER